MTEKSDRFAWPTHSPRRPDPMHGVTLKMIVIQLERHYGWEELGRRIPVNCFLHEPSIASSLKFLRRTPWAREKVEALYRQTCALHVAIDDNPDE